GAGSVSQENKGDPVAYANLLKTVYAALKAVDPEIVVLGGAMLSPDTQWSNALFQAGALSNMDGLSVHLSSQANAAEQSVQYLQILEAEARSANGGKTVPLYVTEFGWPTNIGQDGMDATVAAHYLAR